MERKITLSTKSELTKDGMTKMSKIIDYGRGVKVEIPINRDGTVKFYDDSKLLRK